MRLALTLFLAALALTGCGAAQSSSANDFQGPRREVAQKIEELEEAGRRRDADKVCSEIFSPTLVTQLQERDTSCGDEIQKAIEDADEFDLTVTGVEIEGNQATATVERGGDNGRVTFSLARENGQWRLTSLGS